MKAVGKVKSGLEKKFKKVVETPASFDFFIAIHDFIEHVQINSLIPNTLLTTKYLQLKQIHQGLEDARTKSSKDLGHTRYAVLLELNRIRNNDISESNSFWKKRELFRKLTGEIYERLHPDTA